MSNQIIIFPSERERLYKKYSNSLEIANNLNRRVVSFQANKEEPIYRWFKYKEGFSSKLVKYFLTEYSEKSGRILDPFAGIGTTLFAAQELGWDTHGIELLPIGINVIQVREAIDKVNFNKLKKIVNTLWSELKNINNVKKYINHISITQDSLPIETEESLNRYLTFCENVEDEHIKKILKFAAFTVLEDISYTRKDGQYLRWDYRSNRELMGKPFDKGKIYKLEEALKNKLLEILTDISSSSYTLFESNDKTPNKHPVNIIEGSCLEVLPQLKSNFFDFTFTSPPYCNRYDYTRTYALELVYLGYNGDKIKELRQQLLSCTVENKDKIDYLFHLYSSNAKVDIFDKIINIYKSSKAMNEINTTLSTLNKLGKLNNNNIPRMVKNYFLELCFVIFEISRATKSRGFCVMVNDNVRYGGEEIPVDLILSDFAENFDFKVLKIFTLPNGKGNSSQQMGNYGRTEVRKCVYLWQKK